MIRRPPRSTLERSSAASDVYKRQRDLGVQATPRQGENPVAAACGAVSARIDAIMHEGVSASIKADVTPPRCEVRADAAAACSGQCNVSVDPGYVKAHCAPGHLYGRCEGACSG